MERIRILLKIKMFLLIGGSSLRLAEILESKKSRRRRENLWNPWCDLGACMWALPRTAAPLDEHILELCEVPWV